MSNQELLVKISGDISGLSDAFDQAKEKTQSLADAASAIAKVSAAAFAAFTAEAVFALKAYGEAEAATNSLSQALQNQGMYSQELMDKYKEMADAIEAKTGVDGDNIRSGQAMLQGMVGQISISKDLTQAVVDLAAAKKMDLNSAFELVGKAATNNTVILARYGVQVEDAGNRAQNLERITRALSAAYGGQAEAANQGIGSIEGLKTAFGNLQEEIGGRLAPVVTTAVKGITSFMQTIANSPALMDFITSIGIAGAVVAGLGTVIGVAAMAFLQYKAAAVAAGVATQATSLAVKGLAGATGLGLLIVAASEIALNWNSIWPRVQGVFSAFVNNVMTLLGGLGEALIGVFSFDMQTIKEGLSKAKEALSAGLNDYNSVVDAKLKERQEIENAAEEEKKKKAADAAAAAAELEAKRRAHEARMAEIERERLVLRNLEARNASKEMIDLQNQEIALLEQIDQAKTDKMREALAARLEVVRRHQQEQAAIELGQRAILDQELLTQNEEFQALSDEQKAAFLEKNANELQAQILTEKTARDLAARERLQQQITEHNEYLKNQQKFGTAYAVINKLMHSEIYEGSKQAFGELADLQRSSNATLKSIGKAAAVANIAIKTAEAAMNIYAGFSTIPIIGPALGIAGAAAAIAFGVEQTSAVVAAADGGLMTGGIPGRDSIPTLTMPGELIVPTRNFDEVVSAVAAQRAAAPAGSDSSEGIFGRLVIELKDNLVEFIELKQVERRGLGIAIQGA
jgi:hypothetical protein